MVRALKLVKKTSRAAPFLSPETRARLARSGRVFLLGLVVACGIEVLVDGAATLSDINVLRDRVRARGTSYAAVLTRALGDAVKNHDANAVERLTAGVFDDPEVAFVRATDADGTIVYERIPAADEAAFEKSHDGKPFRAFYKHQLDRDARGVVRDPEGIAARLAQSRHKDFAQKWADLLASVGNKLSRSDKRAPTSGAVVLFQDRLYVENATRDLDSSVNYAFGRVEDAAGDPAGAVIVAFDMAPTNAAIRGKYLKGAGLVAFFVILIIVQNILGRREKLRLLDLETRELSARDALVRALPPEVSAGGSRISGAVSPTLRGIDGMVWDHAVVGEATEIIVLDPQGIGIDAAAVSLHALAMIRARRASGIRGTLEEELRSAGEAANEVPLTRALGVLMVRIEGGRIEGLAGPMGGVRILREGRVLKLDAEAHVDVPPGIVGPIEKLSGTSLPGDCVLIVADGLIGAGRLDVDGAAAHAAATAENPPAIAAWARKRSPALVSSDIAVAMVTLG